ncbi:MAG TPA: hypothetical protein VEI73_16075 [Candidatus Acidoferrum sp.]|nr:hypothetical protein [Candidatus Acidoferrum sp.]
MPEDEDIHLVRSEEERRGKKPIDIAARRRRFILLQKFREALKNNDEEQFKEAIIHVLGQLPGTPEYEQSMKIWRSFHGRK